MEVMSLGCRGSHVIRVMGKSCHKGDGEVMSLG